MKTISKSENREVRAYGMDDGYLIVGERQRSNTPWPRRKWYEDKIALSVPELRKLLSIACANEQAEDRAAKKVKSPADKECEKHILLLPVSERKDMRKTLKADKRRIDRLLLANPDMNIMEAVRITLGDKS